MSTKLHTYLLTFSLTYQSTPGTRSQQTFRSCWRRTMWSTWLPPEMVIIPIGRAGHYCQHCRHGSIVVIKIITISWSSWSYTPLRVQVQKETEDGMEDGVCGEVLLWWRTWWSWGWRILSSKMMIESKKLQRRSLNISKPRWLRLGMRATAGPTMWNTSVALSSGENALIIIVIIWWL